MDPILVLQVSVEKLRSLLRKSAQICAWFEFHVANAEHQIRRIEHRLPDGAPIAVNVDPGRANSSATVGENAICTKSWVA
jgi:hypothetical protein